MSVRRLRIALLLAVGSGPLVAASPYSDFVVSTSPVLYWGLNETVPGPAIDLMPIPGGANNGTYISATLGQVGPRPPAFDNMDTLNYAPSVSRNGLTQYTSLATTGGVGTGAYSVQAWFYSTIAFGIGATHPLHYVLGRGNGLAANIDNRDAVYVGGTYAGIIPSRLYFTSGAGGGAAYGSSVLVPNTWYQTLMVRDGSNVKVYLNGVKEVETTMAWMGGGGDYFAGGNRVDYTVTPSGLGLTGRYDEVAAWNRALTAAEARGLYLAAFSAPATAYSQTVLASNPEAYWRLNEISPIGTAIDATGHLHDFTYPTAPSRTGAGSDIGPRPATYLGFEASNNAPRLIRGTENNSYLANPSGVLAGQNDYSVEMWFRAEQVQVPFGSVYLMHRNDSDNGGVTNCGDYLGLVTVGAQPGPLNLFIFNGDKVPDVTGETFVRGTTSIALNTWHQVAITRQGNLMHVYLDGLLELNDINMPLLAGTKWSNGMWTFGNRIDMLTNNQRFNGNLDEIAIYGGVLSEQIVASHYQVALDGFAIPEPATLSLLALGGAALAARRRRPRKVA